MFAPTVIQVIKSGRLDYMNKSQRLLQEALYEIVTSEASYLKSMHIFVSHFKKSYEMIAIYSPNLGITEDDIKILFDEAKAVKNASQT